jgi:uncharacterized repeat protein (TIGR04076 family)
MPERYKVIARVITQQGHCSADHKVGDEFLINQHFPAGLCVDACAALIPFIKVLQFGGSFPWEPPGSDKTVVACTDPRNPVVFELRRLRDVE